MPLTAPRRRAVLALITVCLSLITLIVPMVMIAVAQAAPTVQIINPSDYAFHGQPEPPDGSPPRPAQVSDRKTGSDESDDAQEDTYRFVAVSSNTPADASLEFELAQGPLNVVTEAATRVANDTFELNYDTSSLPDGQYTLRAILYSGTGIAAQEVSRDERPVLLVDGNPRPEAAAPTVDIDYPENGQPAGFYTHPITGQTNILVDFEYSAGISWVYVFYTLSDPGDEPIWKECALDLFGGDATVPAGSGRLQCVLESQDQGGQSVTGIAVLANDTQDPFGAGPDPSFNRSGDAVRITPYAQAPTSMSIDRLTVRSDTNTSSFPCSPSQLVTVNDQSGRPIGNANVDVHAIGPSDQLKFWHSSRPDPLAAQPPSVLNYQAPDKGHGNEQARACSTRQNTAQEQAQFARRQGEHNRPVAPDVKHIESGSAGTPDSGRWGISMWSDRQGGTLLTFWSDEDDDDQYCSEEPAVAASIGWNQNAPDPVLEVPEKTICPVPVPPPPGSSTGPDPSTTTSTEEPDGCTIRGTNGDDQLTGTEDNDVICAGAGDDVVVASGGDDIVYGDAGEDRIRGGADDDVIDGGFGDDSILGDSGNDNLDGSQDNDVVEGGIGNDTIRGEAGVDSLKGDAGRDVLRGGQADDVMFGGGGNDVLNAWTGSDLLRGGSGDDILRGGRHNDQLEGGTGNDTLDGGAGTDQCRGGPGRTKRRSCER